MPVAASTGYLTELLRDTWGFEGVVVADYFSVLFLHTMHAIAEDAGDAARLALTAGIDVELPSTEAYGAPLRDRVESGEVDEALVDRAVTRVLAQKERLGLLDARFDDAPESIDLDSPAHRDLARRLAEESLVLLTNDGRLPLAQPRRIALIGPNADSAAVNAFWSVCPPPAPPPPPIAIAIPAPDEPGANPPPRLPFAGPPSPLTPAIVPCIPIPINPACIPPGDICLCPCWTCCCCCCCCWACWCACCC